MIDHTIADVLSLDDPACEDPERSGNKAAILARLRRAGHDVPPGLVIPVDAFGDTDDPLTPTIRAALGGLPDLLGPGPWAVRSSSTAEDSDEASYAGQFETFLNVTEPDLPEAILRCYRSGDPDLAYEQDPGSGAMAVLLQPMIPADHAGVVFTADPVSGERSVSIVEAVAGLGDALVGGEVDPERWEVREGRARRVSTGPVLLSEEKAEEIALLASSIETLLGRPQDVEWAWTDDRIYVLQARPITTLPELEPLQPDLTPPDDSTWMLDGGHYPEPISPLGLIIGEWVEQAFPQAFGEFGALVEGIRARHVGWRVYSKVVPLGGKGGGSKPPPWWLLAILARIAPPIRARIKSARQAAKTRLADAHLQRWREEWKPALRKEIASRQSVDLSDLTDDGLVAELDERLDLGRRGTVIHFRLFVPHILAVYRFVRFCEEQFGWKADEAARRMSGLSRPSREPAERLAALAELIRSKPEAASFHQAKRPLDALREDHEVAAALDAFLAEFGARVPAIDLIEPTLGESPEVIADTLASLIRDPERMQNTPGEGALRQLATTLPPDKAARYEELLGQLEIAYPIRDENVLWTVDIPIGLVRLAALEIGARLERRGLLDDAEHVVFLMVEEVKRCLLGGEDFRTIVLRHRRERVWAQRHPYPAYLGPPPSDPPDLRGLPQEVREINQGLMWEIEQDIAPPACGDGLTGVGASGGRYRGPARVVRGTPDFASVQTGDVLVCPVANPAWAVLFPRIGAVIADTGGILSHAAILAREFGIPAVLGTRAATQVLSNGQIVVVDGTAGRIEVV